MSSTGEIGQIVQAAMNGGIWGVIAELIGKIVERIQEVSPIFDYVMNIVSEIFKVLIDEDSGLIKSIERMLQPFLDGFNAVADILGSFINAISSIIDIITAIFNIFTSILNKIAPIISSIFEVIGLLLGFIATLIEMFSPIIDVILDVIAPILEVINQIIKAVYKIIATIINIIIDIYNAISWGHDKDHISTDMRSQSSVTKGYSTYTPDLSGYATQNATSSSVVSGSASYTAAKDLYVNISFANSYVNGDAREIALMLRDEIRSAERLGY